MIRIGHFNKLTVLRQTAIGIYLDDGADGILLPRRFVPRGIQSGETIDVFLYHDSENRVIATTQEPKGVVGDIVLLRCVSVTAAGAFLDWGLMKDLFVAKSQQLGYMRKGGDYLVRIYIDEQTGRVAATQKIETLLSNDHVTVDEMEEVDLLAYRKTDMGWMMIINNVHTGLLHDSQVFREIETGDRMKGFIKTIRPDNKIDVVVGKAGYRKVEDETTRILRLLDENGGTLPYNDRSAPEDIYRYFGMSKKTFKMAIGALYKQRSISIDEQGIRKITG